MKLKLLIISTVILFNKFSVFSQTVSIDTVEENIINRHCGLDPQSLDNNDGLVGAGFACTNNEGEQTSPLQSNGIRKGLRVKPAMTGNEVETKWLNKGLQPLVDTTVKTHNYASLQNCNQNVYERPYSFSFALANEYPPEKGLLRNTGIKVGGALAVMGLLYFLPESTTKWDKESMNWKSVTSKWVDNVKAGPVIDDDTWFMNYVAHPYWGGVFYMSARSLGYSPMYCFIYSAALSTFLWEYGLEAFAEIPSIQDLIVTPIAGVIVGELFYLAKRGIVRNDYRLLNSKILGHTATFIMDPINEFANLVFKKKTNNNNNIVRIQLRIKN